MSTDDRLIIRSPGSPGQYQHDLSLQVQGPDIRTGIIAYIENFGTLYHAKLTSQVWKTNFMQEKKLMLTDLWESWHKPDALQNLSFKLTLINLARAVQRWNFPVLLDVRENSLTWINGHSRLLASGICWNYAWNKVDFLVFILHGQDPQIVQSSVQHLDRITNDSHLRDVLGGRMSINEPWMINAGFDIHDHQIKFQLRGIQDYRDFNRSTETQEYFVKWRHWLSQNCVGDLQVNISASSPSMISDCSDRWTLNHVGSPPDQLISWAQMSAFILNEKNNHNKSDAWHLYHFENDRIDLAEFFFFLDLEHSVFHTQDWSTILVQPGAFFKCKEISLSRL